MTIWASQSDGSQKTQISGPSGNVAEVNSDNQLHIVAEGHLCPCNSTTEKLLADEVFTGDAELILAYNGISVFVTSDVGSAIDGLEVQYSKNGTTNWRCAEEYTILAGAEKWFTPPPFGVYFRLVYKNGPIDQGSFELTTVFRKMPFKWSSHNINQPITSEDDAELNKSVLTGQDVAGVFQNIKATKAGILLVSDYLLEVAKGNITGENIMNKFGENPSIGTGTDPEDIWDGGGIYDFYPSTAQSMEILSTDVDDTGIVLSSGTVTTTGVLTLIDSAATFLTDTVAPLDLVINDTTGEFGIIASVDSEIQLTLDGVMTNGSQEDFSTSPNTIGDSYRVANANDTGAATIQVFGLNTNWESQTETVVLNGTTVVNLAKTYVRINRMVVLTAGTPDGAEGVITCRIQGAGTTAAVIASGHNQTLMAIYTIPAGRTGHFIEGYVAISKGGGANAVGASFTWKARTFGGVFNTKGVMQLSSSGSGWWQYRYAGAPGLPPKTDILIRCEQVTATIGVVGGMDVLLIDN